MPLTFQSWSITDNKYFEREKDESAEPLDQEVQSNNRQKLEFRTYIDKQWSFINK